jgi:hypothetical protein
MRMEYYTNVTFDLQDWFFVWGLWSTVLVTIREEGGV